MNKKLIFIGLMSILFVVFIGYLILAGEINILNIKSDSHNYPSIAQDSLGYLHMVYTDYISVSNLTYCNNTGGTWSCVKIFDGLSYEANPALAIDSNDKIHIIFTVNQPDTKHNLTYCNNTGGTWSCVNVTGTSSFGMQFGDPSIAIDTNNKVHVIVTKKTDNRDYYCNNTDGTWSCAIVNNFGNGNGRNQEMGNKIAIDTNNKVHITQTYNSFPIMMQIYCNNTGGTWSCVNVTGNSSSAIIQTVDKAYDSSIVLDSNNNAHISVSFPFASPSYLTYCNNTGGTWSCTNVTSGNSIYSSAIASGANNKTHIFVYNSGSPPKYCNNLNNWTCIKIGRDTTGANDDATKNLVVKKGRLCSSTNYSNYAQMIFVNGSLNSNTAYANITILNVTSPNVSINSPSNQNYTTIMINFNVTALDIYSIDSCNYTLNNGLTNYTMSTTNYNNFNATNNSMSQGSQNVTFYCFNIAEFMSQNSTPFFIDSLPPAISILSPLPQNYGFNNSINLNYSAIDAGIGTISSCNYSITNKTGGGIVIPNTNLPNCQNSSFNLSSLDNDYNLTLCSNDTLNNWNCSSVTFGIRMQSPNVVSNSPSQNQYFKNGSNIYVNFTASRTIGLDTAILYLNGAKNFSWIPPSNFSMNYTILNLPEGTYSIDVRVNDTLNNIGDFLSNITFYVDLTPPNATINSITTTTGSKIVSFNSSEKDNFQMATCKYTVWNAVGMVDGSLNNISYTCGNGLLTHAFIVSDYGTYTLSLWENDSAGNINSTTNQSFIVSASSSALSGGGGAAPVAYQNLTKICGNGICEAGEDFWNCGFDCKSPLNLDEWVAFFFQQLLCSNKTQPCVWKDLFFTIQTGNATIQSKAIPFNGDTIIGCFSGKDCWFETRQGILILFGSLIVIAVFLIVRVPYEKGRKKVGIPRYFVIKMKKYRKKRGR